VKPALAGFLGGVMGALAVGGALSAPAMVRGAEMDATAITDRVGILEERVAYLEAAQAGRADNADAGLDWLRGCLRSEPSRWVRVGGRMVLSAADERETRVQVATLLPRCLNGR